MTDKLTSKASAEALLSPFRIFVRPPDGMGGRSPAFLLYWSGSPAIVYVNMDGLQSPKMVLYSRALGMETDGTLGSFHAIAMQLVREGLKQPSRSRYDRDPVV